MERRCGGDVFGIARDDAIGEPFEEPDHPARACASHYRGRFDEQTSPAAPPIGSAAGSSSSAAAPTAPSFRVEVAITRIEGDPVLFVSHLRDITARVERDAKLAEASRSLEEAERRHRTLLENLPSITYRAGLGYAGGWEYISPQVEEVLGYTPEEWMSDPDFWERKMHPDDLDRVINEENRCIDEGIGLDVEYRLFHRNGDIVWVRDRASVGESIDSGGQMVEGLLSDVTDRKTRRGAVAPPRRPRRPHRPLQPPRLRARADRADEAGELAHGGAIAIIDLDHLKRVNDSIGHAAGDRVITRDRGRCCASRLRDEDLFARLSGDEFGLVMSDIDGETARQRVLDLLDLVRRREGSSVITASAGIAMIDDIDGVEAADLLIAADTALYEAKNERPRPPRRLHAVRTARRCSGSAACARRSKTRSWCSSRSRSSISRPASYSPRSCWCG